MRGTVVQLEPRPLPPDATGCLPASAAHATAGAPGETWTLGTVNSVWQVGFRAAAGVHGGVVLVGDSLTLRSLHETMTALIAAGYGPICVDAGHGREISLINGPSAVSTGLDVIRRIAASDPVWGAATLTWVVALGTNDVVWAPAGRTPHWVGGQIGAARAAIPAGAGRIMWVEVRTGRTYTQHLENLWNQSLVGHGAIVGWSAAVGTAPSLHLRSDDLIHLTHVGTALRLQLLIAGLAAPG